jgi:hypothetical protein
MLLNFLSYAAVSVSFKGNYRDEIMLKCLWILTSTSPITKMPSSGKELPISQIFKKSITSFLGEDRTKRALTILI